MSYSFRFSSNSMGVAVTSNPRASSGSVALPWVIQAPPSPWQFSWRLCKSVLVPINGLVFQAYCKRFDVVRTGVFWEGKKKRKMGPFFNL